MSPPNMHLGNDRMAEAIKMGFIVVRVEIKDMMNKICITDVLHMPKLQANLLSVSKFLSSELKV